MKSSIYKIRTLPLKILVGGSFTSYNGTTQNYMTRLNSDGTRDISFTIGTAFNLGVSAIAIQPDGKILVGGAFTSYNGTGQNRITRLNSDGTRDTGFTTGSGFNNDVNAIVIQSDGKILVGGRFTSYNGATLQNRIIRLNSNGTRDTSFAIGSGFEDAVRRIVIQSDGKIIVGGYFTSYNGRFQNYITRLNSDGTRDTGFSIGSGFDGWVYAIAIQPDDKILVGGEFYDYDGNYAGSITRLNSDGTLAMDFDPYGFSTPPVNTIAIQPDGKILIGDNAGNAVARLNTDGTQDVGFPLPGISGLAINTIAVQSGGKILVGGDFTSYDAIAQNYITRLNSNGNVDTSFVIGTGFNGAVNTILIS
jgi:uncharacterized delta-60 repeat protein